MMNIGVVGGGIIGVSSAVKLQENFPSFNITILSDEFSPNTTGDGAAGFWTPIYYGNNEDMGKLTKWGKETSDYMQELWSSGMAGPLGLGLTTATILSTSSQPDPEWEDVVFGYRHLSRDEMKKFEVNEPLGYGVEYSTFTCEVSHLMPYLLNKFASRGGRVEKEKVTDLRSLAGRFDYVINCCGLGAYHVVGDKSVYPIRGQVMRVKAPWIKTSIAYDTGDGANYILTNRDSLVLGGTHQDNDWDLSVRPEDTKHIWTGCTTLYPSLQKAEKIKDWVGLRPGRCNIRVEHEVLPGDKPINVIHNYGHGGSGITLFVGCANEVVDILRRSLQRKSKL